MIAPARVKCPTSDLTGDRHFVVDRRWTLTDPSGVETVLCSACCVIFWAAYATPLDAANSAETTLPAEFLDVTRPHVSEWLSGQPFDPVDLISFEFRPAFQTTTATANSGGSMVGDTSTR